MLRDAIVLRSLHARVQEKCLEEGNKLTLAKALEIGRNHETSVSDLKTITEEDATVKFVGHGRGCSKGKGGQDRNSNPKFRNRKKKSSGDQTAQKCTRCGYHAHPKSKCPALNNIKARTCDNLK